MRHMTSHINIEAVASDGVRVVSDSKHVPVCYLLLSSPFLSLLGFHNSYDHNHHWNSNICVVIDRDDHYKET